MATSQKFQVVHSAGKLTNAILACFNWMTEYAKTFVERRTFSVDEKTKLRFFDALCNLARSREERLELIQLGDRLKQKLSDEFYQYDTKKMLAYLILIGISKNEHMSEQFRQTTGVQQYDSERLRVHCHHLLILPKR